MSNTQRNIGIIIVSLGIIGLVIYGYLASQQVDNNREGKVDSNISEFLTNDSLPELRFPEEEEEDLDGEEAIVEDDDFETHQEAAEENWEEQEIPETPPPATPPQKTKPATNTQGSYWVIAGSFKSQRNANKKLKTITKHGYQAEIIRLKDSKLYSVCVAKYEEELEALLLAEELSDIHNIKTIIRQVTPE